MDDVYIVELAVTGVQGFPKDAVAQIAICRMLSDGSDYETIYDDTICLDPLDIGHDGLQRLDSLHGIGADSLYLGEDLQDVVSHVREILIGRDCTSFSKLTFSKFLCFEPWDLNGEVTFLPPLSFRVPRDMLAEDDPTSMANCYNRLCPGDPAGIGEGRAAADLVQMSANIAMTLRRSGFY